MRAHLANVERSTGAQSGRVERLIARDKLTGVVERLKWDNGAAGRMYAAHYWRTIRPMTFRWMLENGHLEIGDMVQRSGDSADTLAIRLAAAWRGARMKG